MPSYTVYGSPNSPPHSRFRDHSPTKSSPLRHTLSTTSNKSDNENGSSLQPRPELVASNTGTAYVAQERYNGYELASDPFVTRTSTKRDRSESPVKKNAAFAKWEQREQAEQHQSTPKPARGDMVDVSPKKVKDDGWRSDIGRNEHRSALRPVAGNTRTETRPTPISNGLDQDGATGSKENAGFHAEDFSTPTMEPPSRPIAASHTRGYSLDTASTSPAHPVISLSPTKLTSTNSLATLSRSDSMRASTRPRERGHARFTSVDSSVPQLDDEDIAKLQKSSTPQLRHFSKLVSESGTEELNVHSPDEQVVGLAGRRKLQRSGSVRPNQKQQSQFASQYASTRWMDTQRRHLQAYEYLCHIGEARAWLQDLLEPVELPPIVQLEEALRDGVTLAEAVLHLAPSLTPGQQRALGSLRIFRNPRLQFRHSDNIALFFRFVAEVELPELFRFELVDLYEKKNVPKVIYCIHALSWLLYRKGIVDFRIGNLLGQLQFEDHELEETQKGIDRSGIQMPNFGGMREAMQVEEEPPPSEPTPEEILSEQHDVIVDLQSQVRGAVVRLRLGNIMQDLWDGEEQIAQFQALARGGFAREVFDFKRSMDLSTRSFQAAAKAFLVRSRQYRKQKAWKDNQHAVIKIQSIWRGRQRREKTKQIKSQLQIQRHGLKELQAAIRGALGRWRAGDVWHETREAGPEVAAFQAAARGALERIRISVTMNGLWDVEHLVAELQTLIRGAQVRRTTKSQKVSAREVAVDVVRLQAAARGFIQRKEQQRHHGHFQLHQDTIVDVQGAARGLVARLQQARLIGALRSRESVIVNLQAALRAHGVRRETRVRKAELLVEDSGIARYQAAVRAHACRRRTAQLKSDLRRHSGEVISLQSLARAMLQRRSIGIQLSALEDQENTLVTFQSLVRAYIERQRIFEQLVAMEQEDDSITQLQALTRAMLLRSQIGNTLMELEDQEHAIVELQAASRAFMVRSHFAEKRQHYRENMQKVIKLQSFVRAKQQGESYQSLVNGKNPPLPVVRRHLHLLTDSNLEFEGELEAERLRRQVLESVRRNELVEGYVEGLDVKIALLVKNKITLDEVVKHQKHYGGSASQLLRTGSTLNAQNGGFDLKALNKSSRKKLTGYEELFFMLQTQPVYLARLFYQLSAKGLAEKEGKNVERLIMTLFGYAQKSREEFLLLKLLSMSAQQIVSQSQSLDDYLRQQSGAFYQRLLLGYTRSPRDRSYLKQLLSGVVREGICGQNHLDLESDPLQIYRAILNNDELSTGQPSARPRDLPREMAIREPDVRPTYVQHLQDLRDLCDSFFLSLEECLQRMPFGIRFMVTEQYKALCQQFPHEDSAHLAMLAGNWLWRTYLLPALREPELWGVVDRGLNPVHKRNLAQVITVLGQVATGRLFAGENLYLQPLNNWVTESLERWYECLHRLFDMPSPEEYFDADQYSDLYARSKPALYIKLGDIFALHSLVSDNLPAVAPTRDDPIKELLTDLGTAKSNESDLSGAVQAGEITLTLKSRFTMQEDPNAEARALFTATKRLVLYIIKVQAGSNLVEILTRPITHEDADNWIQVVSEELAGRDSDHRRSKRPHSVYDSRGSLRGARAQSVYSEAPSNFSEDRRDLLDLESMTYAELKSSALENILALEQPSTPPQFKVSRHNNYQEILNALASDIRQKHRRRLERQHEMESTRATLAQLDAKASFLEDQLKSYNDYIEQCLHTLANKKGARHKFILPFTKQWSHERELERAGRQPKFGSYKYSARQLADKGVLLGWAGYAPEHWGQLNVVISSDEVGVFHLEASSGSMMLPGASANLMLDDLLQAQYDNRNAIGVFEESGSGGGAKLAVNLLLHLVFKKFYRDE